MQIKKVAIYMRVSTKWQSTDRQRADLLEYCDRCGYEIYKEYIDEAVSGKTINRTNFKEMMADARKRKFQAVLIWDLSRLSRSLRDLIKTIEDLRFYMIHLICYNQNIDTSSPSGMLIFQIIGAINEFQLSIIRENVISGLENAKRKGKRLGRPGLKYTDSDILKIKKLHKSGASLRNIGKLTGISHTTIDKILKSL